MLQLLLVDDDDNVAAVLKAGLEEYCGAVVTCASTGIAATEFLQTQAFALAVIDVILPDMSGFDLAETAADINVPSVLISGDLERQTSCEQHEYPHLTKPFSLVALAEAVTVALANAPANIARVHQSHARLMATGENALHPVSASQMLLIDSTPAPEPITTPHPGGIAKFAARARAPSLR